MTSTIVFNSPSACVPVDQPDLVFLADGFDTDQNAGFIGAHAGLYRSTRRPLLARLVVVIVIGCL
jgi:hypothetical protein